MWPLLLIQNVVLLKHIPKIPLLINRKSAHCLLFISSLGCEAKFSIKTQERTPKGGCMHIWKIMRTWNALWIIYLFKTAQNTKTYKHWKKIKCQEINHYWTTNMFFSTHIQGLNPMMPPKKKKKKKKTRLW